MDGLVRVRPLTTAVCASPQVLVGALVVLFAQNAAPVGTKGGQYHPSYLKLLSMHVGSDGRLSITLHRGASRERVSW